MHEIVRGGPADAAEAAAIVAAIRRFRDDHAPAPLTAPPRQSPWLRAALLEGTGHAPDASTPWGEPSSWSG